MAAGPADPADPAPDAVASLRRAAEVHRRNGRHSAAIDLFVEADAWDDVLAHHRRRRALSVATNVSSDFGRWRRLLPAGLQAEPAALLAAGLKSRGRAPIEAARRFRESAEGFRAKEDVDGAAAISHDGVVRWWLNDIAGLMDLYVRVGELRATGSARATVLEAVSLAAVAHLQGDSAGCAVGPRQRRRRLWQGMARRHELAGERRPSARTATSSVLTTSSTGPPIGRPTSSARSPAFASSGSKAGSTASSSSLVHSTP